MCKPKSKHTIRFSLQKLSISILRLLLSLPFQDTNSFCLLYAKRIVFLIIFLVLYVYWSQLVISLFLLIFPDSPNVWRGMEPRLIKPFYFHRLFNNRSFFAWLVIIAINHLSDEVEQTLLCFLLSLLRNTENFFTAFNSLDVVIVVLQREVLLIYYLHLFVFLQGIEFRVEICELVIVYYGLDADSSRQVSKISLSPDLLWSI